MPVLSARRRGRVSPVVRALSAAALAVIFLTHSLPLFGAAEPSGIALPHGPAKAGFDVSRLDTSVGGAFEPFEVTTTLPLRDALRSHHVAADTDLLMVETAGGPLTLVMEQMAYHHIAQGRAGGRDWLVSFCVVCNTGTRLVPVVNGTATRFAAAGVYDGMLVMQDAATGSIWNHITGEALYGPAVGSTLGAPGNVLQTTTRQALTMEPEARIAISDRVYFAGGKRHGTAEGLSLLGRTHSRADERSGLSTAFVATLGTEDVRRPRMDLGLGIWSESGSRYYPREVIRQRGGALIDRVGGRTVLVYVDPRTSTPSAIFVASARATVAGATVRLDAKQTVRDGVLFDSRGQPVAADRPMQVFTRWYGFALTFPATEIYGQS